MRTVKTLDVQRRVKSAGGRWDPVSRVSILRRDTAERLDLLSRSLLRIDLRQPAGESSGEGLQSELQAWTRDVLWSLLWP